MAPVGLFDSGVGGLTVARAVVERLPGEALVYLGDTARVPYGNKSPDTIRRYSVHVTRRLCQAGAKALVVACNTASAHALDHLRERLDVPVLGVIEPVAREAARRTQTGVIGVIGTRATVASGAYERALEAAAPGVRVVTQASPLLVPLAEEGWVEGSVPEQVARHYLTPLAETGLDTLILGCTHYPLLRGVISATLRELTGREVEVLDSASATSQALAEVLDARGLRAAHPAPRHRVWVTDSSSAFVGACARFFGAPIEAVEHVDLDVLPVS